jgi:hypothetical protein
VSDLVVFIIIVAAMAGVGMALGIIVAGRMDRIMAGRPAAPPPSPTEPRAPTETAEPRTTHESTEPPEPPTAPVAPEEEQP